MVAKKGEQYSANDTGQTHRCGLEGRQCLDIANSYSKTAVHPSLCSVRGVRSMTRLAIRLAYIIIIAPIKITFAGCLSYSDTVVLSGHLVRRVLPGRPNYESIAHGDEPESYFFLRLDKPVCVDADLRDPDEINAAASNLTSLQLIIEDYKPMRPYLGKRITLSGKLMGSISPHYHTPVALEKIRIVRTPSIRGSRKAQL